MNPKILLGAVFAVGLAGGTLGGTMTAPPPEPDSLVVDTSHAEPANGEAHDSTEALAPTEHAPEAADSASHTVDSSTTVAAPDVAAAAEVDRLVQAIATLSDTAAAVVLGVLDDDKAAGVLKAVDVRRAAGIMAQFPEVKATRVGRLVFGGGDS